MLRSFGRGLRMANEEPLKWGKQTRLVEFFLKLTSEQEMPSDTVIAL